LTTCPRRRHAGLSQANPQRNSSSPTTQAITKLFPTERAVVSKRPDLGLVGTGGRIPSVYVPITNTRRIASLVSASLLASEASFAFNTGGLTYFPNEQWGILSRSMHSEVAKVITRRRCMPVERSVVISTVLSLESVSRILSTFCAISSKIARRSPVLIPLWECIKPSISPSAIFHSGRTA
jgi:hypothetical protein